ncbi:MAG: TonB-dependent receptor [Chitinophagaceae bacterium]|nr:TonB-dependent receptor [Chitinophagaceae bacterium]
MIEGKTRTSLIFLKNSLFLLALTMWSFAVAAQQTTRITGKITGVNGEPLESATVSVKGQNVSAISDAKGEYSISGALNSRSVLVFSFTGYQTREETVGNRRVINVQLQLEEQTLEDVVIIGYGEVRRKDLTGAITTIKPSESVAQQYSSVDALIRGRAAGVQVTQSNGAPGGALSVKIRGVNSLRGDNEPLYVVDGVIINDAALDTKDVFASGKNASNQESQNGLSGINPMDIESIEILKDASATAIYGSRGANGVVLITTKQGTAGKAQINLFSNTTFGKASKVIKVLDGPDYVKYQNELADYLGVPHRYDPDTLQYIFWQKDLQQTAITQNYRLTASGASQDNKTKFYLAGGLLDAIGLIKESGVRNIDFRINLTQQLSRRLSVNVGATASFVSNNATNGTERLGVGNNSLINQMVTSPPVLNDIPDINEDDVDAPGNPRVWLYDYDDIGKEQRMRFNTTINYRISSAFSYRLNLSTDYREKERTKWQGKTTLPGQKLNGALGLSQLQRKYYLVENLLFFRKSLKNKDRVDATLGITYDNEMITSSSVLNTNFFSGALRAEGFGFGEDLFPYERDKRQSEIFSTLGRVNYSLKDKFIFTVSGRMDGSSKFAKGNKFSFFPAVAVAYRLINEGFMEKMPAFSDFKIRLGYGESGNQAIEPYATFARYNKVTYSDNGDAVTVGTVPVNLANPDLKWETTKQVNAGIDLGFFEGRLTATIDVYHKKTTDLLQTLLLPASSGFNSMVVNRGSLENRGLEIAVNGVMVEKKNWNWSAGGNISFNRNKILDLGLPEGSFGAVVGSGFVGGGVSTTAAFQDPANIFLVGQPIGMFYGYKTDGVYQNAAEAAGHVGINGLPSQPGDLRFIDQDGDGLITPRDKVIIGNPNPKFTYGFNTTVKYKRFSLDLFFNGKYGNQIVNGNAIRLTNMSPTSRFNVLADAYHNAWTLANPTNSQRVGFENLNFVDLYVEDGSFFRLANLTFGYSIPMPKKSKFIKQLDFNITGINLFVLTKYSGFDPEVNSFTFDAQRIGVDWNSYPRTRAVGVGFNFKF